MNTILLQNVSPYQHNHVYPNARTIHLQRQIRPSLVRDNSFLFRVACLPLPKNILQAYNDPPSIHQCSCFPLDANLHPHFFPAKISKLLHANDTVAVKLECYNAQSDLTSSHSLRKVCFFFYRPGSLTRGTPWFLCGLNFLFCHHFETGIPNRRVSHTEPKITIKAFVVP